MKYLKTFLFCTSLLLLLTGCGTTESSVSSNVEPSSESSNVLNSSTDSTISISISSSAEHTSSSASSAVESSSAAESRAPASDDPYADDLATVIEALEQGNVDWLSYINAYSEGFYDAIASAPVEVTDVQFLSHADNLSNYRLQVTVGEGSYWVTPGEHTMRLQLGPPIYDREVTAVYCLTDEADLQKHETLEETV